MARVGKLSGNKITMKTAFEIMNEQMNIIEESIKKTFRLSLDSKPTEEAIDSHDCHLSGEDGCDCVKFNEKY